MDWLTCLRFIGVMFSLPSTHAYVNGNGKITFKPIVWIGPGEGEESSFIGAYLAVEGHKFSFYFYELLDDRLDLLKQQVESAGEYLRDQFEVDFDEWMSSFHFNEKGKGNFLRVPLSEIARTNGGLIYTSVAGFPELDMKILLACISCKSFAHLFCSKTTLDTFRKEGLCSQRLRGAGLLRGLTAATGHLSVDKDSEEQIPETRNIMQVDMGEGTNRVSDLIFLKYASIGIIISCFPCCVFFIFP